METDPGSVRTSNLRTTNHAIGLLQPYCPDGMVCATLAHLENEADVASCCNVVHELMPHRTPSGRNGPGGRNRFQVALRMELQLCRNAKVASWCARAFAQKRKHVHTFTHTRTHTYLHTYIHVYIHLLLQLLLRLLLIRRTNQMHKASESNARCCRTRRRTHLCCRLRSLAKTI